MFGHSLISKRLITPDQLEEALTLQKFKKDKLGRLLVELGYLKESSLNRALKDYIKPNASAKVMDLIQLKKSSRRVKKLSQEEESFLQSHQLELIKWERNEVVLISCDYKDSVIKKAEKMFGRSVIPQIVKPKIFSLLNMERLKKESPSSCPHEIIVSKPLSDEQKLEADNPYSQLIRESIDEALKREASDIHYEPFDSHYVIRFRIHGVLFDWKVLNKSHTEALTAQLKSIVNMELDVMDQPQDSRTSFDKRQVDIRASSFPVVGKTEKIVLRIQKKNKTFSLEKLGLPEKSYNRLLSAIQKQDGLILISGPTGSGKTTTLYSLLGQMDKYGKNISTIENPVEKKLDRINQANISDNKSLSDLESAIMRQDPDTILVGEIRDEKSAKLCMRLSSTGHLVLSTIHANGAVEVIERLKNLGIDGFSIKSSLRLSVAQRLVKKVCPYCSKKANDKLINQVFREINQNTHLKMYLKKIAFHEFKTIHHKGCSKCQYGIIGRMAVVEYLEKNEIRSFVENTQIKDTPSLIPRISLEREYLRLAFLGIIDIKEMIQTI